MSGELVDAPDLPSEIRQDSALSDTEPAGLASISKDLRTLTRRRIEDTLAECDGSVTKAARRLGIHRSTIYRWIGRSGQ